MESRRLYSPPRFWEGRYRLHDLARLFAESRLESREHDEAKQRHTKHYLRVLSDAEKLYKKGGEKIS